MKPSSEDSGWDPRLLHRPIRKQKQSCIPGDVQTLHDVPTARNPPLDLGSYQYPVVPVNGTSRLHFVPVYTGLFIVLTEPDTARIKSEVHHDSDFYLTHEGRQEVSERLAQGLHDEFKPAPDLQTDLISTFRESESLKDPFDESATQQFRAPVVWWLRRRTVDVQYSGTSDLEDPSPNATWNIELEVSEGSDTTKTISIPHEKFLSGQSKVFTTRYKRTFPGQQPLRLSDSGWLDLSQFFIDSARFDGIDQRPFENMDPASVEYRQSSTGTFHLTAVEETTAVCGCSVRSATTRSFDPLSIPLPAAICVNCAPEIKRHRIAIRI